MDDGVLKNFNIELIAIDTLQQQAPAIQIGKASEGEIPGFSTRYVELVFAPEDASEHTAEFYITFSHPDLEPVSRCIIIVGSTVAFIIT